MIYSIDANITVDTSTNKVIILIDNPELPPEIGARRVVLMPVNRRGDDIYTLDNDKPGKPITRASDVLRWIAQNLYSKREVRQLSKENE